jgi:hypothetical protein
MPRMRAPAWLLLVVAMLSAGCSGPRVDLTTGVEIVDFSSGWIPAARVDEQNKIVPTINFKLKNLSDQSLPSLQANVLFRQVSNPEEWGSGFVSVTKGEALEPGATTQTITIDSQRGYTGTEMPDVMLNNSQFVDARVEIFAKYGSVQWVRIGERQIDRRLLGQ